MPAKADSTSVRSSVVIAQMYPGAAGAATQEYVELYNNSDIALNVTGWCAQYISSTGKTTKTLGCFTPPGADTTLWIDAGGYALFTSDDMQGTLSVKVDGYFSSGISAEHGYVRVVDTNNNEIDQLGWGDLDDTAYPAYSTVSAPANGKALQRKTVDFHLQDTNSDTDDFIDTDPFVHASGVYEKKVVVDVCPNLPDAQVTMPDGYIVDNDGNCQIDNCANIDGLQLNIPEGYDRDVNGECMPHDECDNLSDIQPTIPDYMVRGDGNDCIIKSSPLQLTELLPNAIGSDVGNEFIEIYNSGPATVDLTFYVLKIGPNSDKTFSFPVGSTIAPHEYKTFTDNDLKFTLANSSSRVVLTAIGGNIFGDSGIYTSPKENESWALIDSTWQYTNRSTPGAENLASIVSADNEDGSEASSLKPCATNQYRNPETNRCRKIAVQTAGLAPCKAGQYRNPETNRCRNIVTASTKKPCSDDQYRSEETGRCRNLPADTVPDAAFAVQPVKDTAMAFAGWWALGGIATIAIGYGLWEWRRELVTLWHRITNR